MRIFAIITDYLRASLLTTKGDLVKHDGVSAKRFPRGSPKRLLRVNAAGDDLEYTDAYYIHHYLTAKGDLIKFTGVNAAKFPIGTARQIMVVNHAGDDIEYQAAGGVAGEVLKVNSAGEQLEYADPGHTYLYYDYKGRNLSAVALAAGGVNVLTVTLTNAQVGDIYMIFGVVSCLNSGTATGLRFELHKVSGDATGHFLDNASLLEFPGYCENTNSFHANLSAFLTIDGAGTYGLGVKGIGSTDCEVAVGNCQLLCRRIRTI